MAIRTTGPAKLNATPMKTVSFCPKTLLEDSWAITSIPPTVTPATAAVPAITNVSMPTMLAIAAPADSSSKQRGKAYPAANPTAEMIPIHRHSFERPVCFSCWLAGDFGLANGFWSLTFSIVDCGIERMLANTSVVWSVCQRRWANLETSFIWYKNPLTRERLNGLQRSVAILFDKSLVGAMFTRSEMGQF